MLTRLHITAINTTTDTQSRVSTERQHMERLMERMVELQEDGQTIDPIEVMEATDLPEDTIARFYIIDGFHRYGAHRHLSWEEIPVNVIGSGTKRDAVVASLRANADHKIALARNKGDVMHACQTAAGVLKADQLEQGVDFFEVKVKYADIAAMCGLKPNNRTAQMAAAAINDEAREARNSLIAELLSQGKTAKEIAAAAGVSVRTIQNMKKELAAQESQDAEIAQGMQESQDAEVAHSQEHTPCQQEDDEIDFLSEAAPGYDEDDAPFETDSQGSEPSVHVDNHHVARELDMSFSPTQQVNIIIGGILRMTECGMPLDELKAGLEGIPDKRLAALKAALPDFIELMKAGSLLPDGLA